MIPLPIFFLPLDDVWLFVRLPFLPPSMVKTLFLTERHAVDFSFPSVFS